MNNALALSNETFIRFPGNIVKLFDRHSTNKRAHILLRTLYYSNISVFTDNRTASFVESSFFFFPLRASSWVLQLSWFKQGHEIAILMLIFRVTMCSQTFPLAISTKHVMVRVFIGAITIEEHTSLYLQYNNRTKENIIYYNGFLRHALNNWIICMSTTILYSLLASYWKYFEAQC
jgi:hypothetical protein